MNLKKILIWIVGIMFSSALAGFVVGIWPRGPVFVVEGNRVVSKSLDLRFDVPDDWKALPQQPSLDLGFQNQVSGALFGIVSARDKRTPEEALETLVLGHQEKFGKLKELRRSEKTLGGLPAKVAEFSFGDAEAVMRSQILMLKVGPRALCFTCVASPGAFKKKSLPCDAVLHQLKFARLQ